MSIKSLQGRRFFTPNRIEKRELTTFADTRHVFWALGASKMHLWSGTLLGEVTALP